MIHLTVYSDFEKTIEEFKTNMQCESTAPNTLEINDPAVKGVFFYGKTSMDVAYFYFDIEILETIEISRAASVKGVWTLSLSHGETVDANPESGTPQKRPVNGAEFHNLKKNETFTLHPGGALRFSSFRLHPHFYYLCEVKVYKRFPFLKNKSSLAYHEIMDKNMLVFFHAAFDQNPNSPFFKLTVESITHSVLALFLDTLEQRHVDSQDNHYPDEFINKMLNSRSLFTNFKTPPSLEVLSKFVGMGRSQTNELFKLVFGKTPHQFFTDLRMSEAKNLIVNGKHTITEIAVFLGFASQSHFSKAFKGYYGILPKKMQLIALNKS